MKIVNSILDRVRAERLMRADQAALRELAVVMRCGNEYAAVTIATSPKHRAIFTTDPQERRRLRERARDLQKEAQALV